AALPRVLSIRSSGGKCGIIEYHAYGTELRWRARLSRWGDHMRHNMACLAGAHDWSDWEVRDPEQPWEQIRTCARCLRAQKPGDRMWGTMACLAGVHHWSTWEVPDLQQPGEQVRTCSRCPRTKDNAAPVPLRSLFW